MKKYMKYFVVSIFAFVFLMNSVYATTIKETIVNGDGYDTIEDGSIVIGVTKFDSNVVITGSRATTAGSNDAIVYMKLNSSLEGYNAPVIYIYAGGAWFALDENNNASVVEDSNLMNKLSNNDIYFVNNVEKKIDIDVANLNVDEENLPNGVTYKEGKVYVPATMGSFKIPTKDGKEVNYEKDDNEFVINNAMCFTVSNGTITDYSNTCISDVNIPSKIDGVDIIGIAQGAFQNKGITSVVIPSSIMTIEENAFADNELTSVLIKEKFDETDFATLAATAFGDFKDIKYKNELTDFLEQFNDKVTLNVRKGTMSDEIDSEIFGDNLHRLPHFAKYLELKRLGINIDPSLGEVNTKYGIALSYEIMDNYELNMEKFVLSVGFFDSEHQKYRSASKYVSYEINEIEAENDYYKNIEQEYEEYFVGIKEKVEASDYSTKLIGSEKIEELADKYGYSVLYETGYYEAGEELVTGGEYSKYIELLYEDVLYYAYYEMPCYDAIEYNVEIDDVPETDDEIYNAMVLEFEQNTQITNYKVTYNEVWNNTLTGIKQYLMNVEDESTGNVFMLKYELDIKKGSIIETGRNEWNGNTYINYSYLPTKTLGEYEGKVSDYITFVEKELREKASLSDGLVLRQSGLSSDGSYSFAFDYNVDNVYYTYSFNVNNSSAGNITGTGSPYDERIYYEVELDDAAKEGTYEEYKQAAVDKFLEEKNITDYYLGNSAIYVKNSTTGEFDMYDGQSQDDKYNSVEIIDFSTNTIYTVVFSYYW